MSGLQIMILAVAALGAFFMIVLTLANRYSLNIKDKTVGHGQHGTARWASRKEIRRTFEFKMEMLRDEWEDEHLGEIRMVVKRNRKKDKDWVG